MTAAAPMQMPQMNGQHAGRPAAAVPRRQMGPAEEARSAPVLLRTQHGYASWVAQAPTHYGAKTYVKTLCN